MMRLIVACDQCKRQYDASGKQPGRRFRCHCGETLVVPQPVSHEAAVVRCSACGASREAGESRCGHCGADFTLHEQDLDTVCPNCLARVSNQARFCHHCATRLIPETPASDATEYTCPVCGHDARLRSRCLTSHQVAVLECQLCAGLWLGLETFRSLLDREAEHPRPAARHDRSPLQPQAGPRYRKCVLCGQLMTRRNFGRGASGVIVDICGSHGIWFDADELAQLIAWIRSGNLEAALTDMARLKTSKDAVRRRKAFAQDRRKPESRPRPASTDPFNPFTPAENDPFDAIANAAITFLGRLFRRS